MQNKKCNYDVYENKTLGSESNSIHLSLKKEVLCGERGNLPLWLFFELKKATDFFHFHNVQLNSKFNDKQFLFTICYYLN